MRKESGLGVAGTAGLGAGLMFLLDPDMGARRRAILRDKLISLSRLAAWAADKTSRDLKNRAYGAIASIKSRFADEDVSDDVLVERVRSQMGRAVSHPHAIRVTAARGKITLSGEILSDELDDLVRSVVSVKGVKQVYSKLTTHKQPGEISSLQGGHTRRSTPYALLQSNWPPAVRLIAGTSGAIAAGIGAKRGGIIGSMISVAGIALAFAAITNQTLRRIISHAAKVSEEQFATGRQRTIEFPGNQRRTG